MAQYIRDSVADHGIKLEVHRNDSGSTILKGYPVSLSGTSADGVGVVLSSSNRFFRGVANADALDGSYFNVQTKGWCDYAQFDVTAGAVAAGDPLIATATGFQAVAVAAGMIIDAIAGEAISASGANHKIDLGSAC